MEPEASVNKRVDKFVASLRARPECAAHRTRACSYLPVASHTTRLTPTCAPPPQRVGVAAPVLLLAAASAPRPRRRVIAAFGHSDFFNLVMERHCGIEDYWLENCEVYRLSLPEPAALD